MKNTELWKGDIWSLDRCLLLWTKESSKTWAPATSQYIGCYPLCTHARMHTNTHTHTKLSHVHPSHRAHSPSFLTGVSQSAGEAKSSLLTHSCCQSALFQLNEKPSLAPPKTWPCTGAGCWSDQICATVQTPSCFTTNTVLFSLGYRAYQTQ